MNLLNNADRETVRRRGGNAAFAQVIKNLRDTVAVHLDRPLDVPDEGGWWGHNYTCPNHATRLIYNRDKPHAHICEVDGEVFSGGVYDAAWLTYRHNELIKSAYSAALVWLVTEDRTYLEHTAAVLTAYAERYAHYPVHGKNAGQGRVLGQSLDEAVWSIPAAWAYDIIRDALTEQQRSLIETKLLHGLGQHLLTQLWTKIHNIQCWHLAGLATLGVVLDDQYYLDPVLDAQYGFTAQVQEGILEDGWWWEGSPHYHFYTAQALTSLAVAIRYRYPHLVDNARLRRMLSTPLEMLRSDLSLPSLNDGWVDIAWPGGTAQYVQVYERAYALWQQPDHAQMLVRVYTGYAGRDVADALLFGPDVLPAMQPLATDSVLQATSGYAIMRSKAKQLMFKYGPHGGGHGHPDKLALLLWGYGKRFSDDLGTPGYGIPMNDTWYRNTLSHNTVLVNEERQPPATGHLLRFEGDDDGVTVADACTIWMENAYEGVHMRRVVLHTETYFIDIMAVTMPQAQQIDLAWHTAGTPDLPGTAATDQTFTQDGYAHLRNIRRTDAPDWHGRWTLDCGAGVQVWAFSPAGAHTLLADAPDNPASDTLSLVLRRIHADQALFITVTEAFEQEAALTAASATVHGNQIKVEVRRGASVDMWDINLRTEAGAAAACTYRYTTQ